MPRPNAALPSTPSGWAALLTEPGRRALDEVERSLDDGDSAARVSTRLRTSGTPADEAAALLTQASLRRRAAEKFGDAAKHLLFTPAGLEQATRAPVAALHAARFAEVGCTLVADLGCGIGAESLALQRAGIAVHPVEIDPFVAEIASFNLGVRVVVADVERMPLDALLRASTSRAEGYRPIDGVFLDPARRTAGHSDTRRIIDAQRFSPSLEFAFGLGERLPTGVKLGPGLDHSLIPAAAEAQWVSVDGQVVEVGVWFGAVARAGITRSALVLRDGEAHELCSATDSEDPPVRELGEYLYEPDGAVIRARQIGALAHQLGAGLLSDRIAYLTSDRLVATPFAHAFRVVDELPAGQKQLTRELARRDIGTLEIKQRGTGVDPAELRKRLKLAGTRSATLIMTRADGRHVALLADRV